MGHWYPRAVMPHSLLRATCVLLTIALCTACASTAPARNPDLQAAVPADSTTKATPLRIAIWDSGVDPELFADRLARDTDAKPLIRGYDAFKRRQDTAMANLPEALLARRDELNEVMVGVDDLDSKFDSPEARALLKLEGALSKQARVGYAEDLGRWGGYTHGTAVADIALAGIDDAQLVVARMEWWHGSPPEPCWTRELADREAASMRDLIEFIVASGARVVNMSWGRFESSYLSNLAECAPQRPLKEREALARYTVDALRDVLMAGMQSAPDVLFVGAAGNAGTSMAKANPATRFDLPNFMLVGAVDNTGNAADYTNVGPEIALYANGERVPARLPGGRLSHPSGTSMATPVVANAALRVLAVNPRLSGAEVRTLLVETASKNQAGLVLLDAAGAIRAAQTTVN